MNKSKKAVIYCRVSSDKQAREGTGLQSQEKRCRDYCLNNGMEVDAVFKDSYTGGGDFRKRPAMMQLFQYLEAKPETNFYVVFDDIKRLARDIVEHLKIRTELKSLSAVVCSPNYNFEDSPESEFVETIMASQGELERKQNRRQVIQKQRSRMEMGLWAFNAPKGYSMKKEELYGNVCHPNEYADSIRIALEGFANKRFYSLVEVARFLQKEGVFPNKLPAERYTDQTKKMLLDVFYAGYVEHEKRNIKRVKGHHKALIDLTTHQKNTERLQARKKARGCIREDQSDHYPLRGLILCSQCNKRLTAYRSRGRQAGKYYYYYDCKNPQCEIRNKTAKADEVARLFNELLKGLRVTKKAVGFLSDLLEEKWEQESQRVHDSFNKISRELKELETSLLNIEDTLIDPSSPVSVKEALKKRHQDLSEKSELMADTLSKQPEVVAPLRNQVEIVLNMFQNPYPAWKEADTAQKHSLFYLFFEDDLVYEHENGFRNTKKPVVTSLFEQMEESPLFVCTRQDSNLE